MKKRILPILPLLLIFLIPLAQANVIDDLLQNDFVLISMSFVVFFSFIFFALKKIIFGEERMINTIVSLIISYFAASMLSERLGEWVMNSRYMFWTYIVFFIFGLLLLGRSLFGLFGAGEKIKRLKWLAGAYFIIWLFYLTNIISYEPVQEFVYNIKNSIPSYLSNLINILGIISAIVVVIQVLKAVLGLIHPEERKIIWEGFRERGKALREESESKRKEAEAEAEKEIRKREEAEIKRLEEKRKTLEANTEREKRRKERMERVKEAWEARKRER